MCEFIAFSILSEIKLKSVYYVNYREEVHFRVVSMFVTYFLLGFEAEVITL